MADEQTQTEQEQEPREFDEFGHVNPELDDGDKCRALLDANRVDEAVRLLVDKTFGARKSETTKRKT